LYTKEDFVARTRELTNGKGVNVVYDSIGKDTFMQSLDCIKPRGMMVTYGNASGPVPPIDVGILGVKGSLKLTRPTVMTYAHDRSLLEPMSADLFDKVIKGKIKIEINQRYQLQDAAFIWVMWFAMTTNFPAGLARNIAKKVPGFVPEFSWLALIAAIVVTALWVSVVKWRTSRAPKVIWRAVVISAAGTTLTWVLLMTLWLPTINYAKTYRDVAQRLVQVVPPQSLCINSTHLGDGQLASFIYFTKLKFKDDVNCDLWISNQPGEARKRAKQLNKNLELIWEDRRVSDRSERLRLYKVLSHAQ
jgi:hypothetical protein